MVQKHASVGEDLDSRTGLVEMVGSRKTDTEFGWDQCNSSLLPLVLLIEGVDSRPSLLVVTLLFELGHQQWHVPVFVDLLQERCVVTFLVHIFEPQLIHWDVQPFSDSIHVSLGNEHSLWASESAEGRVAVDVRLAEVTASKDVRDLIRVVDMCQAPIHDSARHIIREAAIVVAVNLKGDEGTVVHRSNFPSRLERMSLAASHHIFITVQHTTDWSFLLLRRNS
jgi:hypothetical protein